MESHSYIARTMCAYDENEFIILPCRQTRRIFIVFRPANTRSCWSRSLKWFSFSSSVLRIWKKCICMYSQQQKLSLKRNDCQCHIKKILYQFQFHQIGILCCFNNMFVIKTKLLNVHLKIYQKYKKNCLKRL